MIEGIGLQLQGIHGEDGSYHLSEKEQELIKQGKVTVASYTTTTMSPKDTKKKHQYYVLNMKEVKKVNIFYDIEDEHKMYQNLYLKDGRELFSVSRNHKEVEQWKQNGIKINESYGY